MIRTLGAVKASGIDDARIIMHFEAAKIEVVIGEATRRLPYAVNALGYDPNEWDDEDALSTATCYKNPRARREPGILESCWRG